MPTRKPDAGDVLGDRYAIVRTLAEGGMGAVFVARHTTTNATIALKTLRDPELQSELVRSRFVREARLAAALGHPGIVKVFDAGEDPVFGPFLVMELLEGTSLERYLNSARPTIAERLEIVREMLEALAVAHEAGIVHRDIKPDNVFLASDGEGGVRVKLLDFGIAREYAASSQTIDGTALGTIFYMSPEQMTDARTASFTADVWSVGVMLYEILSNELPFDGSSIHEVAVRVCTHDPTHLSELDPTIDPAISALVMQCLQRDRSARPADARALASMLDALGVQRFRLGRSIAAPATAPTKLATAVAERSASWDTTAQRELPSDAPPTAVRAPTRARPSRAVAVIATLGAASIAFVATRAAMQRPAVTLAPSTRAPVSAPDASAVTITAPAPISPPISTPISAPAPAPVLTISAPPARAVRVSPAARAARVAITEAPRREEPAPAPVTPPPQPEATPAPLPTPSPAPARPTIAPANTNTSPRPTAPAPTPVVAPVRAAPQPARARPAEPEVEAPLSF